MAHLKHPKRKGRRSRRYRKVGVFYVPEGIYPSDILLMIAGNNRIIVSNRALNEEAA